MISVVFDTETTGLTRRYASLSTPCSLKENGDEVVQIGGLVLDEKFEPYRAFCHYCDCLLPEVSSGAAAVNNISMMEVRKYVSGMFLEEVCAKLIPELFSENVLFIGYSVEFDLRMVAQSLRNFCFGFEDLKKVSVKIPTSGRSYLDVMEYLPRRAKLTSHSEALTPYRNEFYHRYAGKLTFETNAPELLEGSWASAHNSLFDSIETYLLFRSKNLDKTLV